MKDGTCGPKLVASGIFAALGSIPHLCVHAAQCGGLKARSMVSAILAIEAAGMALFGAEA